MAMLSHAQSEYSEDRWPNKPSVGAKFRNKKPSLAKRAWRSLIIFCIGVGATLGWQSYGDVAREMMATASPQLGWLAPQTAAFAETAPDMAASTAPAAPSPAPDVQQLKAMSLGLLAMQRSVDQLAAQVAAGQQQMAGDIAKLQAADQEILNKISPSAPAPRPAAAPPRKPVPLTTLPSSQAPPAR
jgi:hypothetical protein